MKVLVICALFVLFLTSVLAGDECNKEQLDMICGEGGMQMKKMLFEKMDEKCKKDTEPLFDECNKSCEEYKKTSDVAKVCEMRKSLMEKMKAKNDCFKQ